MRKSYVCFENNQYIVRVVEGFVPDSVVCECSPQDDLEVMDIVDDIDMHGNVVGKKLEFNEARFNAKQILNANAEAAKQAEKQRIEDLAYLISTDWYVVRFVETGVPIPSEITQLRAQARQRL